MRLQVLNQGGGEMFSHLLRALVDGGHEVRVHSGDPRDWSVGIEAHLHRNARVEGIARKGIRWLGFVLASGCAVARRPKAESLLIVTNPPIGPLVGLILSVVQARRYVLVYYDIYPNALGAAPGLAGSAPSRAFFGLLNRVSMSRANLVVTIADGMASALERYRRKETAKRPILIAPTWVDTEWIRPLSKTENAFARRHGQVGKLTVLYAGNLGETHDLSVLPLAAEALQSESDIHFLVIGDGARRRELQDRVKARGLGNVTFLCSREERELPELLATGDVALVALARGAEGASMPSKTFYAMAAGSAILGLSSDASDLARVIRRHECGKNVEPSDAGALVEALRSFRQDPSWLAACRANARRAAVQEYDCRAKAPVLAAAIVESLK